MTTKEFDEKTLKQLIIDLKDVDNYKSFKHGSFIYDLGYYQGNLLVNEIDRLNNIIKDLLKDIEVIVECEDINIIKMQLRNCLYKLNELKENNK